MLRALTVSKSRAALRTPIVEGGGNPLALMGRGLASRLGVRGARGVLYRRAYYGLGATVADSNACHISYAAFCKSCKSAADIRR
jgi:hypothetical protein